MILGHHQKMSEPWVSHFICKIFPFEDKLWFCTRLQGEWRSVASFSVEPGEIGLTALEEAGDGIDQGAKGRLAQLAAGLTQR
jgi:hypothetical protein